MHGAALTDLETTAHLLNMCDEHAVVQLRACRHCGKRTLLLLVSKAILRSHRHLKHLLLIVLHDGQIEALRYLIWQQHHDIIELSDLKGQMNDD